MTIRTASRTAESERAGAENGVEATWSAAVAAFGLPSDVLILTDSSGTVLKAHSEWPAEIARPGESLLDDLPPGSKEAFEVALDEAVASGATAACEVQLRPSTAGVRWFEARASPIVRSDGVDAVLWILADVTNRRREFERLRRSETILVDAQGVAHLGTWDWDPKEPHATWSEELFRIYGLEPGSHVPSYPDYLSRVHPDDRDRVDAATQAVFRDHKPYSHDERIFRPDGSMRWLHTWAQAIKDDDGNLVRLVGVCQDITERKLAELEVAERLKEKNVLLKEIHHRVKNNLQVIISLLQLQADSGAALDPQAALKEASARVRAMSLVHETLYQSERFSSIDLSAYLHELANDLFQAHVRTPATVNLVVDTEPMMIDMDHAVNCGLLANELISNALKHAFPEGRAGTLRLSLKSGGPGRAVLQVEDDGVGMDPTLFDDSPGTLGLSLVRTLASQLEGAMEGSSNGGTRIRVSFPCPEMPPPPSPMGGG